ncbi:MAG: beta-ketoacyl synthase chain length factor [Rhizobacter sp.]|nr:beta-ketoacyl synthase chain length factor [Rhizobacter sp.]
MRTLTVFVDGLAFWSPALPGWAAARAAFRGEAGLLEPPARRPASLLLAPTERRRAPDTVALALEVAERAVEQSGLAASDLPSVFVSAHGDLAINDSMCATLADQPTLMSPTKFHHSVHNAAAGYWTMGTACMQASTALAAFEQSFAAGLLEAASQCVADARPVLLVGYDIESRGPLASVARSRGLLGAAIVLAPQRGARSQAALGCSLRSGPSSLPQLRSVAARSLVDNAMGDCLPLFEALAMAVPQSLALPLSARLSLSLHLTPIA